MHHAALQALLVETLEIGFSVSWFLHISDIFWVLGGVRKQQRISVGRFFQQKKSIVLYPIAT